MLGRSFEELEELIDVTSETGDCLGHPLAPGALSFSMNTLMAIFIVGER